MMRHSHLTYHWKTANAREPHVQKNTVPWRACLDEQPVDIADDTTPAAQHLTIPFSSKTKASKQAQPRNVLIFDQVLSKEACKQLIAAAEATDSFLSADQLDEVTFPEYHYSRESRKNTAQACLVRDQEIADALWAKVAAQVEQLAEQVEFPTKCGLCADDSRPKPFGVCSLFRIQRYKSTQEFKPHKDGLDFTHPSDPQHGWSGLTLAIYLNDVGEEFAGGSLEFLQPGEVAFDENQKATKVYPSYDPPVTIEPEAGRCVVFAPNLQHTGRPVTRGTKYMIQTSIFFGHS